MTLDALNPSEPVALALAGNRFDRMEWAGAFGDLGTLIPFVVAYLSVLKINPFGILFSFGVAALLCGLYYKTPFPVQPMKAIGAAATTQAAQTALITPAAVSSAGLVTGVLWLLLGVTGAVTRISRWVPRFVALGIILGLGLSFMLEGMKQMNFGWVESTIGLLGAILLLSSRRVPAMFLLLLFGIICGAFDNPASWHTFAAIRPQFHIPQWGLSHISWHDFIVGAFVLAIPQIPLTLSNAVIAICEENNRLFPERRVTERLVANSTGVMNIASAMVGGIPMCHGAGGMELTRFRRHPNVRFGGVRYGGKECPVHAGV